MKKKMRILLLDLPAPMIGLSSFRDVINRIPLPCGYLKAYAYASGLNDDVEIDILPGSFVNLANDRGLINHIDSQNYDLLGFSLYQWNSLRSLHIMRELKRRNSRLKCVAGGPEISAATEYVLEEEALDFLVEGEGEEPFRKLLLHLLGYGQPLEEIRGLMFRRDGRFVRVGSPEALPDISVIPSPYLMGILDPVYYGYLFIETLRGCRFNCRYCSWKSGGRHGLSFFPLERIRRELRLAREKGTRYVMLADSATNISKEWLRDLCRMIYSENRDRFLRFSTYIQPELVDEESACWMREANFKVPTVGLQTVSREALALMGRHSMADAYIRGVNLLKKYEVGYSTTIIIGLPGDTLEGFYDTLDFLIDNNQKNVTCFPLSVAPNTSFRHEASALGIRYQKMPPNYIISTPTMSFDDIRKGIILFTERFFNRNFKIFEKDFSSFNTVHYPIGHKHSGSDLPSFATYIQGEYPLRRRKKPVSKPLETTLDSVPLTPMTRVILSRESRTISSEQIEELASLLNPRLSWNCQFWLRDVSCQQDVRFLTALLEILSADNPSSIWHIVLEFQKEIPLELISEIVQAVRCRPGLLDYESIYEQKSPEEEHFMIGPLIYAVIPYRSTDFSPQWVRGLSERVPLFWSYSFPDHADTAPEAGTGFIIDCSRDLLPSQILFWLNREMNDSRGKLIFFRNRLMERLWSYSCDGRYPVYMAFENMIEIDDMEHSSFIDISKSTIREHMMKWVRSWRNVTL